MIIGLIGSGNIGGTLARLAVDTGHSAVLSNSRGPETLTGLVESLGPNARAATAAEAGAVADLVVVTIPFSRYREVPVEPLAGKVVVDTNNYYWERDGHFPEVDADATTSSELLAAHLPTSRVVKRSTPSTSGTWRPGDSRPVRPTAARCPSRATIPTRRRWWPT